MRNAHGFPLRAELQRLKDKPDTDWTMPDPPRPDAYPFAGEGTHPGLWDLHWRAPNPPGGVHLLASIPWPFRDGVTHIEITSKDLERLGFKTFDGF